MTQWPFLISLAAAHNELTLLNINCFSFYTHLLYFYRALLAQFCALVSGDYNKMIEFIITILSPNEISFTAGL